MTTETEIFFEIIVDGKPLRVRIESNEGRDFCGSETYTLVRHNDCRYDDAKPLMLPDEDTVRRWLRRGSTEWYNASDELHPNWGDIKRSEMSVVKTKVNRSPAKIDDLDFINFETVVHDYMVFDLSSMHRRKGGLPDTGDHQGVLVHPDHKTGKFAVSADDARDKLTGRDIILGYKHVRLVSVVQPDPDYYYILVEIIDRNP